MLIWIQRGKIIRFRTNARWKNDDFYFTQTGGVPCYIGDERRDAETGSHFTGCPICSQFFDPSHQSLTLFFGNLVVGKMF